MNSTTQGFLPPRMTTTQRDAIVTPATGLKIYNTTLGTTDTYDGATWQRFGQQTLIKGSGSTSATTSLLVQNSAGTDALRVSDNGIITIGSDLKSGEQLNFYGQYGTRLKILTSSTIDSISGSVINSGLDYSGSNNLILASKGINSTTNVYIMPSTFTSLSGAVLVNTTTDVASSILTANSTTRGFLPPRMTTTQKNAIATPAAGLIVYDSTTNKLQCYNGSTWNDLF